MTTMEPLNVKLILVSVIGLGLSVYAYTVEYKLEENENYKPMCDFSEHAKCSVAFSSEYGKGFGLISPESTFYKPNSLYGVIHYCLTIILSMINKPVPTKLLLFLVILSNFGSIYFAYILYFILYDFCLVCVSIYIVNAILLYLSYSKHKHMDSKKTKKE